MNSKNNNLLKILLIVLLLAVSMGGVYAYWVGTVKGAESGETAPTINIGEGMDVATKLTVTPTPPTGHLVPSGKTAKSTGSDNVESLTIPVEIKWEEDGTDNIISAADKILGELTFKAEVDTKYADLLTVTVDSESPMDIVADDDAVTVNVEVKFAREPKDQNEYDTVAGTSLPIKMSASVKLKGQ